MIPILYYPDETAFTSNGVGRLADIISCVCSEERNGIYEVEFKYPIIGVHYSDIKEGMIISCTHDENGDRQPFVIYRRSAPIDGVVTFNAHHISYELDTVIVKPFTAVNITNAFSGLKTNSINDNRFTFITNRNVAGNFKVEVPSVIRQLLAGTEGSIIDIYGASDYEFDKFTVRLWQDRGSDNGVTIRYGKNLTSLEQTIEDDTYNAIVPYWQNEEDGTVVYGDLIIGSGVPLTSAYWTEENNIIIRDDNNNPLEFGYFTIKAVPKDFTDEYENQPSVAQLNSAASSFLSDNQPWFPSENLRVDFASMWQTDEYASYANLQTVKLCDTVHVVYNALGVNAKAKVIRTDWNVLKESYDSIELGKPRSDFASLILAKAEQQTIKLQKDNNSRTFNAMEAAISNATNQLTGNNGGSHIVFALNADGGMEEMFIMDTADVNTAVKIWRYNSAGWGYSSNGIAGPYTLAATQNGAIVADFITSGKLQGYSDQNYWDLTNGRLVAEYGKISLFDLSSMALTYKYLGWYAPYYSEIYIGESYIGYSRRRYYGTGGTLDMGHMAQLYDQGIKVGYFNINYSSIWEVCMYIESFNQDGFQITGSLDKAIIGYDATDNTSYSWVNWQIYGNFAVTGTKNRVVDTKDYSNRRLYSYETASPMFGDIGEGKLDENGTCYIWLDPILVKTINTDHYQVFIQAYGMGECFVAERHGAFFIVEGTPGLAFGWELKAKQAGYESVRLGRDFENYNVKPKHWGAMAQGHLEDIKKERGFKNE